MHAIKEKPVVVNGEIVIRPIMVVALTYDHRLLDGREAVTFLGTFCSMFHYFALFVLRGRPHALAPTLFPAFAIHYANPAM